MSHRFMLLFAVLLMMGVRTAAQGSTVDWQTWLYSRDSGRIWMIDASGAEVLQRTLPIPPGSINPSYIAVSPDGSRLVYQAYDQIYVYQPRTDDLRAAFGLPSGMSGANFDSYAFNDDGTLFGVGYTNASTTIDWRLIVYNVDTLTSVTLLNTDPIVTSLGVESGWGLTVWVRAVSGDLVWFTLVGPEISTTPTYPSYVWNMTTHTLQRTNNYATLASDTLRPGHEVIIAAQNLNLPLSSSPVRADPCYFTIYQDNVLEAFDPVTRVRAPFYHDAELTFRSPRFIENGARIVASAFGPDNINYVLVLGRDGHRFGYWQAGGDALLDNQYQGVPDGFIYVMSNGEYATLYHVNTTTLASDFTDNPGNQIPVWRTADSGSFRILWASQGTTDYSRLPAWA
jgi:hypothetical protein